MATCALALALASAGCGQDIEAEEPPIVISSPNNGTDPGGTPANTSGSMMSDVCDDFTCAEAKCLEACQQLDGCGWLTEQKNRDCQGFCDGLAQSFEPEDSSADCATKSAAMFECVAGATCDRLKGVVDYDESPVCGDEIDDDYDSCFYGDDDFQAVVLREVSVDFLGALIAPAKATRAPWDGLGSGVSADDWASFISLLGQLSGQKAVTAASRPLGQILDIVNRSVEPPDVYGTIEWDYGTGWTDIQDIAERRDTFLPSWSLGPYEFLPAGVQWRIALLDADEFLDDDIGTFVITEDQVLAAAELGGDTWIVVGDEFNPQVVAVHVAATFR